MNVFHKALFRCLILMERLSRVPEASASGTKALTDSIDHSVKASSVVLASTTLSFLRDSSVKYREDQGPVGWTLADGFFGHDNQLTKHWKIQHELQSCTTHFSFCTDYGRVEVQEEAEGVKNHAIFRLSINSNLADNILNVSEKQVDILLEQVNHINFESVLQMKP